jgi:hypothetical protein
MSENQIRILCIHSLRKRITMYYGKLNFIVHSVFSDSVHVRQWLKIIIITKHPKKLPTCSIGSDVLSLSKCEYIRKHCAELYWRPRRKGNCNFSGLFVGHNSRSFRLVWGWWNVRVCTMNSELENFAMQTYSNEIIGSVN